MDDDQAIHNPEEGNGFVKKTIETPIVATTMSTMINPQAAMRNSVPKTGLRGFYKSNKIYFWAIIIGVVIIAVLSYFAFRSSPAAAPKNANVSISISVPQTVATGGDAVYKITVQNNDTQKLVNLQLDLAYPDGMAYVESTPQASDAAGDQFSLPDLIPGQNVALFLKASVSGNINAQEILDVKLHYQYSNFNSDYVQEQTSTIQLTASNVALAIQGPSTTNNSQLVMYTVNYQNNSGQSLQNAQIQMVYPDGFTFAAATPAPDLGNNTWDIGTLASSSTGSIQIQGTYSAANPGEGKTIVANFLILGQNGQYYTQNTTSYQTSITSLPLVVSQALVPQNTTGVINPGDYLTFNVNYQNSASIAATGVNIEVNLNSKVINPSTITAQGAQINNNSIIWNASNVPQLASLLPNQQGQLSFSVKVNNPATKDASTDLALVSSIEIKSNEYSTFFPGNQLTLKVSSPSSINASLTFGSGQLPPQVGKSTIYQVSLSLVNSSNDFSGGVLTASLPQGGFVSGSVNSAEANNVQYNPTTSQLTWNVGSLPANTGRFTAPRVLQFGIILSPAASEAGQSPTLLNNINFTANDLFTSQPVNVSANNITTNDVQGSGNNNNGIVEQ
jgi:hypothetical protein